MQQIRWLHCCACGLSECAFIALSRCGCCSYHCWRCLTASLAPPCYCCCYALFHVPRFASCHHNPLRGSGARCSVQVSQQATSFWAIFTFVFLRVFLHFRIAFAAVTTTNTTLLTAASTNSLRYFITATYSTATVVCTAFAIIRSCNILPHLLGVLLVASPSPLSVLNSCDLFPPVNAWPVSVYVCACVCVCLQLILCAAGDVIGRNQQFFTTTWATATAMMTTTAVTMAATVAMTTTLDLLLLSVAVSVATATLVSTTGAILGVVVVVMVSVIAFVGFFQP